MLKDQMREMKEQNQRMQQQQDLVQRLMLEAGKSAAERQRDAALARVKELEQAK